LEGKGWKSLEEWIKAKADLDRRQRLLFQDAVNTEELGYNFNGRGKFMWIARDFESPKKVKITASLNLF
jgi:hypothetical protein